MQKYAVLFNVTGGKARLMFPNSQEAHLGLPPFYESSVA
jgi:hypothetical protein